VLKIIIRLVVYFYKQLVRDWRISKVKLVFLLVFYQLDRSLGLIYSFIVPG